MNDLSKCGFTCAKFECLFDLLIYCVYNGNYVNILPQFKRVRSKQKARNHAKSVVNLVDAVSFSVIKTTLLISLQWTFHNIELGFRNL